MYGGKKKKIYFKNWYVQLAWYRIHILRHISSFQISLSNAFKIGYFSTVRFCCCFCFFLTLVRIAKNYSIDKAKFAKKYKIHIFACRSSFFPIIYTASFCYLCLIFPKCVFFSYDGLEYGFSSRKIARFSVFYPIFYVFSLFIWHPKLANPTHRLRNSFHLPLIRL